LLFGSSLIFLGRAPLLHGQVTGEVCLAEIGSTKCPAAGPVFNGPLSVPATQLRVAVFINSSDSLNGFDITLKTDHNILQPSDTDLTGTILPGSPILLSKCIGGVNRTVAPCPSYDTADTLQLAAVALGPGTLSPTTGLLFTAVYNITQTTAGNIPIGLQTGCSTSSVADPNNICVTISSGTSLTPVPEKVQVAGFNNASPPPWISISSSSSTIGVLVPGISGTATITTSGQNGWPNPFNPDSITFTHRETPGLSVSFPSNCGLTATCSRNLSVSSASEGNYSVTILGEYTTYDSAASVDDRLVAAITLQVKVQAFTISLSPTNITFDSGTFKSIVVNVNIVAGFTGTVVLAASLKPAIGLTLNCSSSSVTASSPSSTCTFNSSTPGTYNVTITGTSSTFSHSANATVKVLPAVQLPPGPGGGGVFGLQPLQLGGIVAGVAVAAILVFLFFRRRKPPAA
jgi:hypothetical protein